MSILIGGSHKGAPNFRAIPNTGEFERHDPYAASSLFRSLTTGKLNAMASFAGLDALALNNFALEISRRLKRSVFIINNASTGAVFHFGVDPWYRHFKNEEHLRTFILRFQ